MPSVPTTEMIQREIPPGAAEYRPALNERFARMLEGIADGIVVQDSTGRVVFCNIAAARQCGFPRAEDLLHVELGAALSRLDVRDESGAPVQLDPLPVPDTKVLQIRDHSTGQHWYSRVQTTSFRQPLRPPSLTVSFWHDVTAERRAREQLVLLARAGEAFSESRSYEETMRAVVDVALPALGDFAFVDVVEGQRVRRLAAAYEDPEIDEIVRTTQWARSQRTDINVCALSSGRSALHSWIDDAWRVDVATSPEHLAMLRKLLCSSMITVPLRVRGEVLGSLTACFGRSRRQHTDEDLKLAEELARRAGVALEQVRLFESARQSAHRAEEAAERAAQANRVKDEFLATVSHELRTPLNAVVGWSSLLRDLVSDPTTSKGVDAIHRNAQMQGKIIEDLLDASRITMGQLRLEVTSTDLVPIITDALEVVRPLAVAKGLKVHFEMPSRTSSLAADPERLQQVISNLLSNAVKFTDPGGEIHVSVSHEDSSLSVVVRDTGRGIDPGFLPFIFDRFKQADSSTTRRDGGLGLGLSIARHIVELHGGQVHAESGGLGRGARFTVVLPIQPRTSLPGEGVNAGPLPPGSALNRGNDSLAGVRVLVVDDDPDTRELLEVLMRSAGVTVETAGSAAEGLEALERFRPHVLVSDISMPGEDGYSFVRRIRARKDSFAQIPAIALTAYTREEDRAKALGAGFNAHLGKPMRADELFTAVARVARTGITSG